LGVSGWLVFGGSWGSTLALAYAETHPSRVLGMVLRGIFLCRESEIEWFYQQGANVVFPDFWQDYLSIIPDAERGEMVKAYYRRLTGNDELARMAAAKAWSLWEARTATLLPNKELLEHFSSPHVALSLACVECHYFVNNAFMEPNQLLKNAHKLSDIPGIIIHGRYDLICPIQSAWELHHAWPSSDLKIVDNAGHAATEPGITKALIRATDYFAELIS
jgi:proline iminopeptidase